MILSLQKKDIVTYWVNLINNHLPDTNLVYPRDINPLVDMALDKLNHCFGFCLLERYKKGSQTLYNHLYSDHNIVLFWFLASIAHREFKNTTLANKLYYLNKIMHGFDCMYDTNLPDVFLIFHGSGTVLGKATYSNFFVALQGVTVGSHKGGYPNLGSGVALASGSSVIGNCSIGDNSSIGSNTHIFRVNVPSNSVAYSNEGKVLIKEGGFYSKNFFDF